MDATNIFCSIDNGSYFILADYISFTWKPLSDITTYELAQLIEIIIRYQNGAYMTRAEYDELPDGVRRHIPTQSKLAELAEEKGVGR